MKKASAVTWGKLSGTSKGAGKRKMMVQPMMVQLNQCQQTVCPSATNPTAGTPAPVWEGWLKAFMAWKVGSTWTKPIAKRTQHDYKTHVSLFFRRFPDAVKPAELERCLDAHFTQEMAPDTFNLRLSNLKKFFDFLTVPEGCQEKPEYKGHIPVLRHNPLCGRSKRKTEGRIVRLPDNLIGELLKLPKIGDFVGNRDWVMLLLQIDCAIRPSEALALLPGDLDLDRRSLVVRASCAKTREARTLPISEQTSRSLRIWLAEREKREFPSSVPLFCSIDGSPISENTWYRRLCEYGEKLGTHIRPYDLRHYAAMAYYEKTSHDIFKLQALLGHSTLEMTQRYVRVCGSELVDQHDSYSPLSSFAKVVAEREKCA